MELNVLVMPVEDQYPEGGLSNRLPCSQEGYLFLGLRLQAPLKKLLILHKTIFQKAKQFNKAKPVT